MENSEQELSYRERCLLVRGDTAIATLSAIGKLLKHALETNQTMKTHLDKVQQQHNQSGTLLDIVTQVTHRNVDTLSTTVTQIDEVLLELNSFAEITGVETHTDNAIDNVIQAIRQSSEFYKDKSDDEIKAVLGL